MGYDVTGDDLVHVPWPDEPDFQESHWVMWWDEENGIGGLHRFGIEPARGTATFWCGVVTSDGLRFRSEASDIEWSNSATPEFAPDRDHRLVFDVEGAALGVRIREAQCEVALDFHQVHDLVSYLGDAAEAGSSNHFEGEGRVTGHVRLGDREFVVDGVCFRDRTWGIRRHDVYRCHRWVAGTFGPDLWFSATVVVATSGDVIRQGFVVRDGTLARAVSTDVVVMLEPDGLTHRGGVLSLELEDGETFRVEIETVDGMVFSLRDEYVGLDTICPSTPSRRPTGLLRPGDVQQRQRRKRVSVAGHSRVH